MLKLTCLIHPCYYRKTIFDIIKNTNLLEGDLIRFFRQIVDKIHQIRNSTQDERLIQLLNNCEDLIENTLMDVDLV